jgi:hypothetical protein
MTCKGSASASVKCDGSCNGDYEPLSCTGGKLEGGCQVDAKCDANCDASVQAKAECTPPTVTVVVSASGNAELAAKLKATLEAHLGVVYLVEARLQGMADAGGSFAGNISAVTDIKAACIPALVAAASVAVDEVTVSLKASADIIGSIQ